MALLANSVPLSTVIDFGAKSAEIVTGSNAVALLAPSFQLASLEQPRLLEDLVGVHSYLACVCMKTPPEVARRVGGPRGLPGTWTGSTHSVV
jgi:hypothetical protein